MKRSILLLFCFAVFLTFTACGGGAANDPKAFMNETADVMESYMADLGKVENVDDAVAVTEKYTKKFVELGERGKVIMEKYPELKEAGKDGKLPEGYEDVQKRMQEVMTKFTTLFQNEKLEKIMQDPKYQEANMKLMKAMQSMGGE